jgi:hypothetical protein
VQDGNTVQLRFLDEEVTLAAADAMATAAPGSVAAQLRASDGRLVLRKGKTTIPFSVPAPRDLPSSYVSKKTIIEYTVVTYVPAARPIPRPCAYGAAAAAAAAATAPRYVGTWWVWARNVYMWRGR